jgi:hypothetical protein
VIRRGRSHALVAAGIVYLLAYPVLFVKEGLETSGAVEPRTGVAWALLLLLGPLCLGTGGCLEIARRFSPVRNETRLDNARRWVGSIAFGISYPVAAALTVEIWVERAEPFGAVLLAELFLAASGLVLVAVGLVLAAVGLVAHLARGRGAAGAPRDFTAGAPRDGAQEQPGTPAP